MPLSSEISTMPRSPTATSRLPARATSSMTDRAPAIAGSAGRLETSTPADVGVDAASSAAQIKLSWDFMTGPAVGRGLLYARGCNSLGGERRCRDVRNHL